MTTSSTPQTLPEPTTPRWQVGTWILTAPDGRTWQADSPLKACAAEQRERVPPEIALKRIFAACDESAKPQAVAAIPEGWKLVPIEPTHDMIRAGCDETKVSRIFTAMLAAAPQPPAGQQDRGEVVTVRNAALEAAAQVCNGLVETDELARAMKDSYDAKDTPGELSRLRHVMDVGLYNSGIEKCAKQIRSLIASATAVQQDISTPIVKCRWEEIKPGLGRFVPIDEFYLAATTSGEATTDQPSPAAVKRKPLVLMREAFRIISSCSPENRYQMIFSFPNLEKMHDANYEWHKFIDGKS